ncbi:MAG: stage sporulation protein [Clostridiales bacterium]|jgi:stage II sporulation protein P|nr:stage sporulation protein [Clostridiales bacterium]
MQIVKTRTYNKLIIILPLVVISILTLVFIIRVIEVYQKTNNKSIAKAMVEGISDRIYDSLPSSAVPLIEYTLEMEKENKQYLEKQYKNSNYNKYYAKNFPLLSYVMDYDEETYETVAEIYPILSDTDSFNNGNEDDEYNWQEIPEEIIQAGSSHTLQQNPIVYTKEQISSFDFLSKSIYTFDGSITVKEGDIDIQKILSRDITIGNLSNTKDPKVLIYHTHSQEAYTDSKPGVESDTVVGVGDELARILKENYGVNVIHHKGKYDIFNGIPDRTQSYSRAEIPIQEILDKYPSIELVIDLHRDGVGNNIRLVTEINGKPTAKIMFFNGLCKVMKNGKLVDLNETPNPYIAENMAFSLSLHLKALELYPSLPRRIYVRGYRYNLHFMPNTMLVEIGAQTNTVQEAKNAMEPLAKIIFETCSD